MKRGKKTGLARRILCAMMACGLLGARAGAVDAGTKLPDGTETALPVLMYHHFDENASSSMVVSPDRFAEQMEAVRAAGYTAVTAADLVAYVDEGKPLPEKPVWITMDDGYESNTKIAAPILEQNGLRATIFVIGVSMGKTTYKDMGIPITPHFSYEEAAKWIKKGVIEIGSHTYDMHNAAGLDTVNFRPGAQPRTGESLGDYMDAFRADITRSRSEIESRLHTEALSFAYPFGAHNAVSEMLLQTMGVRVSVTIREGINTLTVGDPTCLYAMDRMNITDDVTGAMLVRKLEGKPIDDLLPADPTTPETTTPSTTTPTTTTAS